MSGTELKPLLHWLLARHPQTPRTRAKQWIAAGRVNVDGSVLRKPHQLMPDPGERLVLSERSGFSSEFSPPWQVHPAVGLLYLDSSLAIINKGPGLISVPAPNSGISALDVLASFLGGRLKPRGPGAGRMLPAAYRKLQPLPVHRLDQYTSGALCLAMDPAARTHLIEQLRAHRMQREYIAFVQGLPVPAKGTWRNWLQPSANGLGQRVVPRPTPVAGTDTREAVTHYEVLEGYGKAGQTVVSKLRLSLATGLKHQIRVQAAHAGVPVIGDRTYNPAYHPQSTGKPIVAFSRQALHAERLTVKHPERAAQVIRCTAPWPRDLVQLEAELKRLSRTETG